MATITWQGEPGGPEVNTWNGHVFRKGEGVDITDAHMIAKAKTNRFYTVSGDAEKPAKPDPFDHDGDGKPGGSVPKRPGRPPKR